MSNCPLAVVALVVVVVLVVVLVVVGTVVVLVVVLVVVFGVGCVVKPVGMNRVVVVVFVG